MTYSSDTDEVFQYLQALDKRRNASTYFTKPRCARRSFRKPGKNWNPKSNNALPHSGVYHLN
jgi:hypothetical protein